MALKSIPFDLTVVLGPKGLGAFVDSGCATPVTSLHWGEIPRGHSSSFNMHLKNTGEEPLKVGAIVAEDISAWGSVTMAPASVSLNADQVQMVILTAAVLAGVAPGVKSGTLELVEVP